MSKFNSFRVEVTLVVAYCVYGVKMAWPKEFLIQVELTPELNPPLLLAFLILPLI